MARQTISRSACDTMSTLVTTAKSACESMGPRCEGALQLAVASTTQPATIDAVAGEQRLHSPAVSTSSTSAPAPSAHDHSSGRFDTR